MPATTFDLLLDKLDEAKHSFGQSQSKKIIGTLESLRKRRFVEAESLIRYHELLLFFRAYPPNPQLLRLIDEELKSFHERVEHLRTIDAEMSALEHPEVSGIAGTTVTDTFSYYIVNWLLQRYPKQVRLNWEWFEDENRIAETWPRFMALLDEDSLVEANVPYRKWLREARGRVPELRWLVDRFAALRVTEKEKAELYDSQRLYVAWTPSFKASRTGMTLPTRDVFYHRARLIQRRDLSFRQELEKPSPPVAKLSRRRGQRILDLARETSTVRYRELYGFTHGDPRHVLHSELGRGVELFVVGVPAGKRLPLRAYHAAMIFKNGIPVGYFEGLSLCERMESGFNFYYSFREGETAWIYARTLNVFRHLLNVTAFSIDPYQIGRENEEGIESGAFWFYRKLGFRPTTRVLTRLTESEERKIGARSSYRTPARVLRQLATDSMILELDEAKVGDWDKFQVRNIGFAVQRRMATKFRGDAEAFREAAVKELAQELSIRLRDLNEVQMATLGDFAVALNLSSDVREWSRKEKRALVRVIAAKSGGTEAQYLKLMQKHARLREELIRLGSGQYRLGH